MNKEKFLMELRAHLSILENQEQEDILAEYAQHIDMKMQKGLSEEEAIRDIGSMQDLAAEILEAYHVKPEFRKKGIVLKLPELGVKQAEHGESALRRGIDLVGKKLKGAAGGIRNGFRWLVTKCFAAGRWLMKPFTGRKRKAGGGTEENGIDNMNELNSMSKINIEETGRRRGRIADFGRAAGRGIMTLWKWFLNFCVFCLKLMWNAGWLLLSLFYACMAMITLMGAGAIPVLLVQGYPLVGIFMICLGGLLCLGTLSCGAFSMLIRNKKDKKNEDSEKNDEEVSYEQTA